ncbi:MAG: hypothetical protein WA087_02645 [Candidatus Saccharimonadales bacterium]
MNISKKLSAITLGLALILSIAPVFNVAAQSIAMNSAQTEIIRSNCVSAKTKLKQLQASDALLRVNMGQTYETILTKLMEKLNGRLSSNDYGNGDFVSISINYRSTLDSFRSDYIAYEKQLSSAIDIDCSSQPVSFYDAVVLAQTKRGQVHGDITKLNQFAAKYESTLGQFEKNYQKSLTRNQ